MPNTDLVVDISLCQDTKDQILRILGGRGSTQSFFIKCIFQTTVGQVNTEKQFDSISFPISSVSILRKKKVISVSLMLPRMPLDMRVHTSTYRHLFIAFNILPFTTHSVAPRGLTQAYRSFGRSLILCRPGPSSATATLRSDRNWRQSSCSMSSTYC